MLFSTTFTYFSVFFNFLLRLSISSAFIFFSPASILHGHCILSISSVCFFSSSPASRQSRHLNQKTKKKGKEKVQRVRDRERAGRKKEEEERRKKKSLRWTGLDCWRRLEVTETVGKGLKSNPAEIGLPAETSRNGRNRSEQAEILAEVEHRGDSYRLACRYEIFRPFRPERNGLYNTGFKQFSNSSYRFNQVITWSLPNLVSTINISRNRLDVGLFLRFKTWIIRYNNGSDLDLAQLSSNHCWFWVKLIYLNISRSNCGSSFLSIKNRSINAALCVGYFVTLCVRSFVVTYVTFSAFLVGFCLPLSRVM